MEAAAAAALPKDLHRPRRGPGDELLVDGRRDKPREVRRAVLVARRVDHLVPRRRRRRRPVRAGARGAALLRKPPLRRLAVERVDRAVPLQLLLAGRAAHLPLLLPPEDGIVDVHREEVRGGVARLVLAVHFGDRLGLTQVQPGAGTRGVGDRLDVRLLVVAKDRAVEGERSHHPALSGVSAQSPSSFVHAPHRVELARGGRGLLLPLVVVIVDLLIRVVVVGLGTIEVHRGRRRRGRRR
mmetsp:Transcript_32194/g.76962  ORF Transcript_32194/g.76962 Transcript_32194/m.76962 type:complete len:240 (+) Transcript_32194:399-1118(+)